MKIKEKLLAYARLGRIDKPIGFFLLLWPTLLGLLLAVRGIPSTNILLIFIVGVFLTRTAGCIINDYADKDFDFHVTRTKDRPLTTGIISNKEALTLFLLLMLMAFYLVTQLNTKSIIISFFAAATAIIYPFMKRYINMPQLILGISFAWSIPMAYAAVGRSFNLSGLLLTISVIVWAIIYDTQYAMVDKEDDLKLGLKSTAIFFGRAVNNILFFLKMFLIILFVFLGIKEQLNYFYYLGLFVATVTLILQQLLLYSRDKKLYFKAFKTNNLTGLALVLGLTLNYL